MPMSAIAVNGHNWIYYLFPESSALVGRDLEIGNTNGWLRYFKAIFL